MTYQDSLAKIEAAKVRKAKRAAKGAELWLRKSAKKKKSPSLSKLKKALWTEISLLVRSWSPKCLACGSPTQVAAHIVPSNEGAMTRYFLPNLYPACVLCNGLEKWNRGSWVKKHEDMFGADYVNALYLMAQDTFQIKKWWVLEQTERMRKLRLDTGHI